MLEDEPKLWLGGHALRAVFVIGDTQQNFQDPIVQRS